MMLQWFQRRHQMQYNHSNVTGLHTVQQCKTSFCFSSSLLLLYGGTHSGHLTNISIQNCLETNNSHVFKQCQRDCTMSLLNRRNIEIEEFQQEDINLTMTTWPALHAYEKWRFKPSTNYRSPYLPLLSNSVYNLIKKRFCFFSSSHSCDYKFWSNETRLWIT